MVDVMLLVYDVPDSCLRVHLVEQFGEVQQGILATLFDGLAIDKLRVPDDIVQLRETHLGKVFAHLLCKKGEIVYQVFITSTEATAQFGVLCCHTYRTSILVALAHHHTAQHDQGGGGKTVFLRTEHRHQDDVPSGL